MKLNSDVLVRFYLSKFNQQNGETFKIKSLVLNPLISLQEPCTGASILTEEYCSSDSSHTDVLLVL